ncbi:MAG: transposase [Ignavibacteriales bacterium]|nr:transposase [Ignavibacteriales bacterium]
MSIKTKYIQTSNEYFHVYNRGVERKEIFFNERNFTYFIRRMTDALDPTEIEIVAYCLMPNHFHLLLFQKEPEGITKFVRSVCDGYAKAINKERSRTGHLFEGKYKIKQIESDDYLLHLSRYIHLNPVRAQLVSQAEEWEFSSCREYFEMRENKIISNRVISDQIGNAEQYRKFVEEYHPQHKEKISRFLFS